MSSLISTFFSKKQAPKWKPKYASDAQVREWHPEIGKKKITKAMRWQVQKEINQMDEKIESRIEEENYINSLKEFFYNKLKIPKEFKHVQNPKLEIFINFCLWVIAMTQLSTLQYVLTYKSGQKLVTDLFYSEDKKTALKNFILIVKTIYKENIPKEKIIEFFSKLNLPSYLDTGLALTVIDKSADFTVTSAWGK
jgi:hypothetical protein